MSKIYLVISLFILASCGSSKPQEAEVVSVEEISESINEALLDETPIKERAIYRETETILTDLVHTKLEVNFDWDKARMNGVATITAKPHFYNSDSIILDAKGMDINSVKLNGNNLSYVYKDDFLRIKLDRTYTRKENYTIVVDYVAKPEERESEGSAAITSAKGLYFINHNGENKNKMPQIWTQGETEASSVWFPTIDSPNAKTTQEIFITVDDKYTTLSNGALVSSKKLSNGQRVDHWKQSLPHAPYLFMMGIGEFKVVKDTYTRQDGSKMDVHYYVEPEWESSAKAIFGETPEMIRFFSEKMGIEYPWDKYHQIVVRDYVSGAMENTGAVIFGDFVYQNERELLDGNSESIIAHELFHHWFGDMVTCESWSNLTLNESFANYSQYLWDEHKYGKDEADYQAELEADGYYQSGGMQGFHNLVWFDYDDKEQMFDGHSYNKGGRILHMLRNYLGDEAFFAGMNKYLTQNKFKAAEFHHLRLAFEEVSGEDLNWFFNQWYMGSGHPILKFKQEIDTVNQTVTVTVVQEQDFDEWPIFKLPIEMATFDENGKHVHDVLIDEVEESFVFPYEGEMKGILYDHQQVLLAKSNKQKTTDQYIFQYYHGEKFTARRDGLMKGSRSRDEKGQQLIFDALSDDFWKIRQLAISKFSKLKNDLRINGIEKLKDIAVNDENSSVRSSALNALGKYLDENELTQIYADRITNDLSYTVVSSSLSNLAKTHPEDAIKFASDLEKENSSKMIVGLGTLYADLKTEGKYDFFEKSLMGNAVQGFGKLGLLNSFTQYLVSLDDQSLEKSLEIYGELATNGGFYTKMFLPQNLNFITMDISKRIAVLNKDIEKHETNEDIVLADEARRNIKSLNKTKEMFEALIEDLEKGSGNYKIIVTEEEE